MSRNVLTSVLFCVQIAFCTLVNAQPVVGASIKPLQLIAAAITADISGYNTPQLIIGPAQDPHHPSLRPSERRTIYDSDVIVWVGPQLEAALVGVIEQSSSSVIPAYQLSLVEGLAIPDVIDPHVWLSTQNARLIATALAERLLVLDAGNEQNFIKNLNDFNQSMQELDAEITTTLQGMVDTPFAVYHNAFRYYEKQFGIAHIASYTENEEMQPGIRKVMEVRNILEANDVSCLILEPSNNPEEISMLTGRDMNLVSIDILGFDYAANKNGYRDFMFGVTNSIKECLQQ